MRSAIVDERLVITFLKLLFYGRYKNLLFSQDLWFMIFIEGYINFLRHNMEFLWYLILLVYIMGLFKGQFKINCTNNNLKLKIRLKP